jgi:hypothetical protein
MSLRAIQGGVTQVAYGWDRTKHGTDHSPTNSTPNPKAYQIGPSTLLAYTAASSMASPPGCQLRRVFSTQPISARRIPVVPQEFVDGLSLSLDFRKNEAANLHELFVRQCD